jgi:hypothetical protein
MPKTQLTNYIIIAMAAVVLLVLISQTGNLPVACTADAKICPDGSAVGRVPPDCKFSPCPCSCMAGFIPSQDGTYCVANCTPGQACPAIATQCINETCVCPQGYVQDGDICNPQCYYSTPRCLLPSIECNSAISVYCIAGNCQAQRVPFGAGTLSQGCYGSEGECLEASMRTSCDANSDCVPEQCCHPTSCINKAFKGVCNVACTLSCETLLDCGAGTCGCVNSVCTVVHA